MLLTLPADENWTYQQKRESKDEKIKEKAIRRPHVCPLIDSTSLSKQQQSGRHAQHHKL